MYIRRGNLFLIEAFRVSEINIWVVLIICLCQVLGSRSATVCLHLIQPLLRIFLRTLQVLPWARHHNIVHPQMQVLVLHSSRVS